MARFTKSQRLLSSREFDRVLSGSNTKVVCSDFVLLASGKDESRPSRLGLIVSGKVGNSVVRNRVKRSIRSVFQTSLWAETALIGRDLVVIARPSLVDGKGHVKANIQDRLQQCANRLLTKLG
ncbi:MAG: ribonuclease P protein component [bacterium]|jgi:ribonuclease P protein component